MCVILIYLIILLVVSFIIKNKSNNSSTYYFLGDGKISWFATSMSIYATMLSPITFISYPSKAYFSNWEYLPLQIGLIVGTIIILKYYIPKIIQSEYISIYELLEKRFNLLVRVLCSLIFILFMILRISIILYLTALPIQIILGIPIIHSIIILGFVTLFYSILNGIKGIVICDTIQGFILVSSVIILSVYIFNNIEGGFNEYINICSSNEKFKLFNFNYDLTASSIYVIMIGGIFNHLISYTTDQNIIQRYKLLSSYDKIKKSLITNMILCVLVTPIFFIIGSELYVYYYSLDVNINGDGILPYFICNDMHYIFSSFIIVSIISASMSTISSNINSLTTSFSIDFYKRLFKGENILKCAKVSSVIFMSISVCLSILIYLFDFKSMLDLFQEILGLLIFPLFCLISMSFFSKKIKTKDSIIASIISFLIVIFVKYFTNIHFLLYGAIGVVSFIIIIILYKKRSNN